MTVEEALAQRDFAAEQCNKALAQAQEALLKLDRALVVGERLRDQCNVYRALVREFRDGASRVASLTFGNFIRKANEALNASDNL